MPKILSLLSLFFFVSAAYSQELEATVIINSEKVETQEKQVFEQMKRDIVSFLNNRRWTEDDFEPEEKIQCTFLITLIDGQVTSGSYTANMQVQSARPVYNSDYEAVMLNFLDKDFKFNYRTSQPMNYNENTFNSNLTSTLAYFANIILALDYDSFSEEGGDPYLEKARTIQNAAVSANAAGWSQSESNSKFWLAEDLNNQIFLPFREALYKYHRTGLDIILDDPVTARKNIAEAIEGIHGIKLTRASSILLKSFFNAKSNELIGIFSEGDKELRKKVSEQLQDLDPLNTENYTKIVQ